MTGILGGRPNELQFINFGKESPWNRDVPGYIGASLNGRSERHAGFSYNIFHLRGIF